MRPASLRYPWRTGRVDRIGSLVQRRLDGVESVPSAEEWLQVFYPHLRDTVDALQVRRIGTAGPCRSRGRRT